MKKTARLHLYVESKTVEFINIESRVVVARGWGVGKMRMCRSKDKKFQLCRINNLQRFNVQHDTIINNTVLYN